MKNKLLVYTSCVYALLMILSVASAFADTGVDAQTEFVAELASKPLAVKEWTMMVYLNGNNSLDPFGATNINQMEKVGSDAHTNIVVQWASLKMKETKRLYITKDFDVQKITSPVVQTLSGVDMGKKESLEDFIAWTHANFPAKHYFIVVWNHGGGWHFANDLAPSAGGKGAQAHVTDISWDDKTGHSISTEQLGEVMRWSAKLFGHKVDLYGSDACLMAMVEVASEMAGAVETFVGSEELEPGSGWPYDSFLADWQMKPQASSLEIGKMLASRYGENYNKTASLASKIPPVAEKEIATFSVLEMSKLPALVSSLKRLKTQLLAVSDKSALQDDLKKALRFTDDPDYADISSLLARLSNLNPSLEMSRALADVNLALGKLVYFTTSNCNAGGVSIWWPTDVETWNDFQERYGKLAFNIHSGWNTFLTSLFK